MKMSILAPKKFNQATFALKFQSAARKSFNTHQKVISSLPQQSKCLAEPQKLRNCLLSSEK
jgi:hypothetical protein